MIEINKIYNENCLQTMEKMLDNFIDLTITSPPYDNLRTYDGYSFDFENISKELYRVTKEGGVLVWVVGDQVAEGNETGTSFKQALHFKELGFKLFDTMIYVKNGGLFSSSNQSYIQKFEYMFVFTKDKIKKYNLIRDRKNKNPRDEIKRKRTANGSWKIQDVKIEEYGRRHNIWEYTVGIPHSTKDKIAYKHPAIFPEKLVEDHIISWSDKDDLIYDPFLGSGTTAKMALLNNRNFIGSEINEEYCEIAKTRTYTARKIRRFLNERD